ncbi:putative DNA helicase [Aeromonas phage Atoyac13]|uniref:Putative DNA helicase n=1 Tax=Aeromonas phage Atoyac1 TaxID=2767547 RepID=A0A866D2D6_9CAUD|nr:putative DNA helicase [Aeromonas phage Atoyac1]QOC54258.1 putative DNA helicase [Aeromonas phage Atoyac10]QOC54304.1 putative DNA helicase [Aeromonas phage Atoyac13]QOC54350.1 putative DNA helicase [Aeromonas phage Atoyac14]QOC54446.1 putative DNA helicase [Aeromonas phage Atoyac23]
MLDSLLLAVLSDRNRYKALISAVPMDEVGTSTKWLLNSFKSYFDKHPKKNTVDYDVLATMVRLKLEGDAATPALKLIEDARGSKATKEQQDTVVATLYEMALAGTAAKLVNEYHDGAEIDLSYELYRTAMETRKLLGVAADSLFKEPDIHEILEEQGRDEGLKFRQLALQNHIKGLMPPLSLAVCAPVDAGKTSFLADALTFFAPQCQTMWPGRPIIWLSNEGVVREIWPRVYSSALGLAGDKLVEYSREGLFEAYSKAVGGDRKIIRMLDVHGWSLAQVASLVEELNPIIVVFDMLANFKLPGVEKKHEKMEALFQEVREMAALHDFIALSTVQLSAEGYDQLYPPGTALKDTKIGVQGALDIQIMLGRLNDPTYELVRGLSLPKNKRKVIGRSGNMQAEVIFQPDIARFIDN